MILHGLQLYEPSDSGLAGLCWKYCIRRNIQEFGFFIYSYLSRYFQVESFCRHSPFNYLAVRTTANLVNVVAGGSREVVRVEIHFYVAPRFPLRQGETATTI